MKVVHSKTPTENVTVENIFWEPYEVTLVPSMQEEEECPLMDEIDTLQDAVIWLAEDILDHEDVLHMLGEKIQSVEDDQLQDIENLSNVVDILGCLQEAHKLTLDTIIKQNETIKVLDDKIRNTDNAWLYLFWFLVIWNIILSVLFALSIYDVL